jgi:hypothetical protein
MVAGRNACSQCLAASNMTLDKDRLGRGLAQPLPLAGGGRRVAPGGGYLLIGSVHCGSTPTPALPRKRERERTFSAARYFFFP